MVASLCEKGGDKFLWYFIYLLCSLE